MSAKSCAWVHWHLTDDLLLSYEQCEFVLPFISELGKLNSMHFGANVGRQINNLAILKQIWKRRIGVLSVIVMFKESQRRVSYQGQSLPCEERQV